MMPVAFNFTLMNSASVLSKITNIDINLQPLGGNLSAVDYLDEQVETLENISSCVEAKLKHPSMIWPYFGNLQLTLRVADHPTCRSLSMSNLEYKLEIELENLGIKQKLSPQEKTLATFFFRFDYIQTPPRNRRLLFDQFHSLKFPDNGYIMRDSLANQDFPFEWNGDHLFTNYV
mmetsp:Transcript_24365/g.37742  ORF Transcript_24365/g.37742 Transcript_24365/m.37742 type:complete len:175 (+) Transcript_24365:2271-2795(+)